MFWMNSNSVSGDAAKIIYSSNPAIDKSFQKLTGTAKDIQLANADVIHKENKLLATLKPNEIIKLAGDNCYVYKSQKGFVYIYGQLDFKKSFSEQKGVQFVGPVEAGDLITCALNDKGIDKSMYNLIMQPFDTTKKVIANQFYDRVDALRHLLGYSGNKKDILHVSRQAENGALEEVTKDTHSGNAFQTNNPRNITNYNGENIPEMNKTICCIKLSNLKNIMTPEQYKRYHEASNKYFSMLKNLSGNNALKYNVPTTGDSDTQNKLEFAASIAKSVRENNDSVIDSALNKIKGTSSYCSEGEFYRNVAGFKAAFGDDHPYVKTLEKYAEERHKSGPVFVDFLEELSRLNPKFKIQIDTGNNEYHLKMFNQMKGKTEIVDFFKGTNNHFEKSKFIDVNNNLPAVASN